MSRLTKTQATRLLSRGHILMLTLEPQGRSFALDNGIGVTLRAGVDLTQSDLPGIAAGLVANEDGLFPGCSQTWRAGQ